MNCYDIPENVDELFANGERSYSITDPEQPGSNSFGMNLFLNCVDVPSRYIEEWHGTQVVLYDEATGERIQIDCGGLGDFHLHGFDVTVL